MNKSVSRALKLVLAFLLVFTTFAPSLAFAAVPLTWEIEIPEGYTYASGGDVRVYNPSTDQVFQGSVSGSQVAFYSEFAINDSDTYIIESAIHFRDDTSTKEITAYDYRTLSGSDLNELSTLSLPENGKEITLKRDSIPLTSYQLVIVSKYEKTIGYQNFFATNTSKVLTAQDSVTFSVGGQDNENQGYFASTSIQTAQTDEVDFTDVFTQLVPLDFQGEATIQNLQLRSKAYSAIWQFGNNINKWYVTPGSYDMYFYSEIAVAGGTFGGHWKKENVEINAELSLTSPTTPDTINPKNTYWFSGERVQVNVEFGSNGFQLLNVNNQSPLTSILEVKGNDGTILAAGDYPLSNFYMSDTLSQRYSGKGEVSITVLNGQQVLAKTTIPFEFQDQVDTSIHGLVVTAEDEKGISLTSANVTVYERLNPNMYESNPGYEYNLDEVYRTNIQEHEGAFEAFIPNANLLAGREYEVVVQGYTGNGEKIIYHKSVTGGNLSTIEFKANELTEVEIKTDKVFQEGHFGIAMLDMETKEIVTYPYMVEPNQKVYVRSDYSLLANAQLVNTNEDKGYLYSSIIDLGENVKQTILLDSFDGELTKVEAPAGYEYAKMGIHGLWWSDERASTFYVQELEFYQGLSISLDIQQDGIHYEFYKYHYEMDTPINLDVSGNYTGGLMLGSTNSETKARTYYTYYQNQNGMELVYVGSPYRFLNSNDVTFTVVDRDGNKTKMSTNARDGFVEATEALASETTNLLSYRVLQNEAQVGNVLTTRYVDRVVIPGLEPGNYQLKLEEQLFPTDVVTLQMDQGFTISNSSSMTKELAIRTTGSDMPLSQWGDVRAVEVRTNTNGTKNIYNYLYFNLNSKGLYETYSTIRPEAEYYLFYQGQGQKNGKTVPVFNYQKMTGAELLALSEFVIDHQRLVPVTVSNETVVKDSPQYRMMVTLEEGLTYPVTLGGGGSSNTKYEAYLPKASYEPILEGTNGTDAYSILYPKIEVTKAETIRLTTVPTVTVNIVQNNEEVPFKGYGVRYGTTTFHNEIPFSYDKKVLRKLHLSPGVTSLRLQLIKIEENETPWKYEIGTDIMEFKSNTTLTLSDQYNPVERFFYTNNLSNGNSYIDSNYAIYTGDFYLYSVYVGKESQPNRINSITTNEGQPIRDYDGRFQSFENVRGSITITDEAGKVVHKADNQYGNVGYGYVNKKLKPGKYTFKYEIPVGPNKTTGYTKMFDVLGDNSPFVTLQSPANNSISNNRNVTVTGNSNANASVNVKIYNHGTETVVSEKSVTADADGHFTASFVLSADGKYDIYGYTGEVHSNLVTFTVDTTPPAKPENVQVEQISNTLKVTWNTVSDAQSYKVEMATGTGAFQTLQESNTTNQYTLTAIQPGTTYKFRITAKDAVGNLSTASDIASFETSTFVVTKLEVLGEASSFNLYKVGQELQLHLEGSYQAGYSAKATVTYETDDENTSEVNLTYNEATKKYEGTFTITEGMTKLTKVEGWIINDRAENTDKLTTTVNKTVGATFKGQVTEAGADLTGKARVRLVGATSISIDTDETGHFSGEGIPAGDYTVNVVYPLIGGKTFYNVTNGKVTLANGQKTQLAASISLPAYRDIKLTFVEKGTTTAVKNNLQVQITNNSGYAAYGYINENGEFITWGNVTTLKGLQTGDYQVQVYRQGLYKDTTQNITIAPNQDYVTNPFVIEVDKITEDVVDITLLFSGNITDVDSVNLYSWKAYEAFGYSDAGYYYVSRPEIVDGKLVLRDVVYSDDYQLVINKQGYRQFIMSPIVIDENSENLQVFMDQGLTITGKITNNNGEEVPAAQVYAYSNSSYASVNAGQDGSFELTGLASDEDMTLQVTAPNHVTYQHTYRYNEVGTPLNIVLNKATFVHGKVVDKNNKPLKYVYINAYSALTNPADGSKELGQYKGWARTGSDGYFKITGLEDGEYDLYISDYNYPSKVERGVATETDGLVFMLQEEGEGSFVGAGNSLTASKQSVVPGKTIQYRLNYQNNGDVDAENVPLKVNLPANVEIIPQSVQLNGKDVAWNNGSVTVAKVAKGEKGSLTFEVTVKDGSEAVVQTTATINDTPEQPAEVLSAVTSVLFVTINAPATTAEKKIKVYGNAKTGSNVEVYANGSLLSKVKVDGRWWFAEVTLPVTATTEEESFTLVAKVLDGTESVTSEPVVVDYSPSIPQIKDLTVYAGWNGNVKINPYTGLATFAIVEKTPLDTTVVFNEEIDSASITFLGETYNMTSTDKKTFTFDGRRLGDWSSYGEQLLELTYKKGDITITLPIMEIIVLIDPSGFVFEGSMDTPLAGVTAVVEQKVNNQWVRWNAEFFGQINPQVTDENGRYGWDVIQGEWRVVFTKDGYDPYISRIVTVPPPETQLNVPMVRNTEPVVDSITPAANSTTVEVNANMTVTFDRLMSTVDKDQFIKLYKINGDNRTEVQGTVLATELNGYKETGNATGFFEEDATKKLAKTFTFDPAANLEAGVTYELEINENFADYGGKQLGDTVKHRFTTKQATTPPPTGGGVTTPAPATLEVVNGVLTVDEKWIETKDAKGTVKEDAVLAAITKSTVFDKLELKGAAITDFAFSTKLVKAIIEKNSKATVVVENDLGSFTLPASALTGKLGSDSLQVVITVKKSDRSFLEKGVTILSSPVEFNITVSGNGKTEQINRFSSFVERTINLTGEANVTRATAVKLNENVYVSAPTLFVGKTATIKSQNLGTYIIVQAERSFSDVDNGKNWAEKYIETLASKGIIKGKSETIYGADDQMTRAQFAMLISRSLGLTASGEYKGKFKDITTEQAANELAEVIAAYEAGIIQGKADGNFAPNSTITRAEAAAMLARAMKVVGYDAKKLDATKKISSFKDAKSIGAWAAADVELMVQAGIINGMSDHTMKPNAPTKRDQMAKMLADFLVFIGLMNK